MLNSREQVPINNSKNYRFESNQRHFPSDAGVKYLVLPTGTNKCSKVRFKRLIHDKVIYLSFIDFFSFLNPQT